MDFEHFHKSNEGVVKKDTSKSQHVAEFIKRSVEEHVSKLPAADKRDARVKLRTFAKRIGSMPEHKKKDAIRRLAEKIVNDLKRKRDAVFGGPFEPPKGPCDTNNGGCQQVCQNLFGSPACTCNYGYMHDRNDETKCIKGDGF